MGRVGELLGSDPKFNNLMNRLSRPPALSRSLTLHCCWFRSLTKSPPPSRVWVNISLLFLLLFNLEISMVVGGALDYQFTPRPKSPDFRPYTPGFPPKRSAGPGPLYSDRPSSPSPERRPTQSNRPAAASPPIQPKGSFRFNLPLLIRDLPID